MLLQSTAQPAIQPLPTGGEDLLIRKDYDPKMRGGTSGIAAQVPKYFVNELTGEKIPLDEVNKHVKYNLLDPRWLEEKERQQREKQQQEEVFAIGNQIGDSLKQFSERRTDIFGAGDEETMIGRKLGEEEEDVIKRDERAIWDGHTASVESTTKRIQANITIQDQIDAIHKAKGLSEDSSKEKIGPQLGASSSGGESSSAVPKKPEGKLPHCEIIFLFTAPLLNDYDRGKNFRSRIGYSTRSFSFNIKMPNLLLLLENRREVIVQNWHKCPNVKF